MPPKNAATAAAPTPAAPVTPPSPAAGANPVISDYVREAVREKATRDWQRLQQRTVAFAAIEQLLAALATTERAIAESGPIILAAAPDVGLGSKIKKLRRAVDEAGMLSQEIVGALGGATSREALEEERSAIREALRSAGLDESALEAPKPPPVAASGADAAPADS
jgi:hypothetical protein